MGRRGHRGCHLGKERDQLVNARACSGSRGLVSDLRYCACLEVMPNEFLEYERTHVDHF